MDQAGEESAAELALEASLSFLDDYETIAAEWLTPQALDSPEADLDILPANVSGLERQSTSPSAAVTSAAPSAALHRQNKPRSRSRTNSSSLIAHRGAGAAAGPRNSNRARDERKYELIYLRRHAEELEAQLHELRGRAKPFLGCGLHAHQLSAATSSSLAGCHGGTTWKETARRLCAERQMSEKENIRLRLLVDRQLKTARRLEKMVVRKRGAKIKVTVPETVSSSEGASVSAVTTDERDPRELRRSLLMDMMPNPVLFDSTEQTFEMLLRGTERARDEVDAVFSANGLSRIDKAYRSAKVEQDSTNGTGLEFVASKLLASDVNTVHQAAWRHFGYSQPQMPYRTLSEYHDERKVVSLARRALAAASCRVVEARAHAIL